MVRTAVRNEVSALCGGVRPLRREFRPLRRAGRLTQPPPREPFEKGSTENFIADPRFRKIPTPKNRGKTRVGNKAFDKTFLEKFSRSSRVGLPLSAESGTPHTGRTSAEGGNPVYLHSYQVLPEETSTERGTESSAADSISRFKSSAAAGASVSDASRISSSWT